MYDLWVFVLYGLGFGDVGNNDCCFGVVCYVYVFCFEWEDVVVGVFVFGEDDEGVIFVEYFCGVFVGVFCLIVVVVIDGNVVESFESLVENWDLEEIVFG